MNSKVSFPCGPSSQRRSLFHPTYARFLRKAERFCSTKKLLPSTKMFWEDKDGVQKKNRYGEYGSENCIHPNSRRQGPILPLGHRIAGPWSWKIGRLFSMDGTSPLNQNDIYRPRLLVGTNSKFEILSTMEIWESFRIHFRQWWTKVQLLPSWCKE